VAPHWEEAGGALEAARWYRRAARWTEDTDPSTSLRSCQKVRALLADAEESSETSALRIAACRGILSAAWRVGGSEFDSVFAQGVFAEGRALAERSGDLRSLAILFSLYGNAQGTAGDMRAYCEHATEALRLAERSGDPVIRAAIASDAHPFIWTGRPREGVQLAEEGIALGAHDLSLGEEVNGIGAYIQGLVFRGAGRIETGLLEAAASDLDRASRYAAERPSAYVWTHGFQALRAYRCGDAAGALAHARCARERAETSGGIVNEVMAQTVLGAALVVSREWIAAEEAERGALATMRARRVGFGLTA
jgi:hypothetical protein